MLGELHLRQRYRWVYLESAWVPADLSLSLSACLLWHTRERKDWRTDSSISGITRSSSTIPISRSMSMSISAISARDAMCGILIWLMLSFGSRPPAVR